MIIPTKKSASAGFLCLLLALAYLWPLSVKAADSVCAEVRMQVIQELTFERQGFDAHMRINNGLQDKALEDVHVTVWFRDATGTQVGASSDPNDQDNENIRFFIRLDRMNNIDLESESANQIAPGETADIHWLIIPTPASVGDSETALLYFVGATLEYKVEGDELEVVEVDPDMIHVQPLPQLTLEYFLEREVYANDPFTDVIEPSEPFTLGLRVSNHGSGVAENLEIESAQPVITENDQGLPVNFNIIDTWVNNEPAPRVLLASLGDVAAGESTVARWRMLADLRGEFTEFHAEVSHAEELGGALTSLIDEVATRFLVRDVLVDLPGRDSVSDFLAYEEGDSGPLRVYESDGGDFPVDDVSGSSSIGDAVDAGTNKHAPVTLDGYGADGVVYARLNDPLDGERQILGAIRSDGKQLPAQNVWATRSREAGPWDGGVPEWEHHIHIFDVQSTGEYTVIFGDEVDVPLMAPSMTFIPDRTLDVGESLIVDVHATDPQELALTLEATPLPSGAAFEDSGEGQGAFTWTPSSGQAGDHEVTFTATNESGLSSAQTVLFHVSSEGDGDDGDGDGDGGDGDGGSGDDGDGEGGSSEPAFPTGDRLEGQWTLTLDFASPAEAGLYNINMLLQMVDHNVMALALVDGFPEAEGLFRGQADIWDDANVSGVARLVAGFELGSDAIAGDENRADLWRLKLTGLRDAASGEYSGYFSGVILHDGELVDAYGYFTLIPVEDD